MMDIMGMGKNLGEGLEELNRHLRNIERFTAANLLVAVDAKGEEPYPAAGVLKTVAAAQLVLTQDAPTEGD
jgi:hypothetical protein